MNKIVKQINRIPRDDPRYDLLLNIPEKDYDPEDGLIYVYLRINEEKDFYMVYKPYEIQLQTLTYIDQEYDEEIFPYHTGYYVCRVDAVRYVIE